MMLSPEQAKDLGVSGLAGIFTMLGCMELELPGNAPIYFGLTSVCLCLVNTILSFSFESDKTEEEGKE